MYAETAGNKKALRRLTVETKRKHKSLNLNCCILKQYHVHLQWSSHGFPSWQFFLLENAASQNFVSSNINHLLSNDVK